MDPAAWPFRWRGHSVEYFCCELDALLADRDLRSADQPDAEVLALAAEGALVLVHSRTLDPGAGERHFTAPTSGAAAAMSRHDQGVRRLRITRFTAAVVMVTALFVVPLLLTTSHDASYTCQAGSLVDVIHPEAEMGADFRREVAFDSGYTCNRTAREQVGIASGLVLIAVTLIVVRRRRERATAV
jgi:hypothetical protein